MKKTLYHNWLFLLGFIYYLVCPLIIGHYKALSDFLGMHLFYNNYPNKEEMRLYYLLVSLFFVSFFAGSFSALFFKKASKTTAEYSISRKKQYNLWMLYLVAIINQYIILSNRALLFTGYTLGYHVGFLGEIATLNCTYIFLYLYLREDSSFLKKDLFLLKFLLLENSIILLGLGSRMFVLIPFIALLIYLLDNKIVTIKKMVIPILIFIFILLFIGIIRQGSSGLELEALLFIGLAEPVFTWITAGSFVINNQSIELINFPSNFLGTFLNFIPSFIFPNKADYIKAIPYFYESPLGAGNIIVLLYGNFGLLLAPIFTFIGGFLLTVIRYSKTCFFKIYYYCVCGIIPFILFRDMQSFNKLLFTSFLIYPFIVIEVKIKTNRKTDT